MRLLAFVLACFGALTVCADDELTKLRDDYAREFLKPEKLS